MASVFVNEMEEEDVEEMEEEETESELVTELRGQGLTLVHFSAQSEPFLPQDHPLRSPGTL